MIKPYEVSPTRDDAQSLESSMVAVATAMSDPSRVSMLCALMDGRAWTATELCAVSDIASSTASAHLNKLLQGQLVSCLSQGRHRYYRLASREIAALLENLMGVSMRLSTPQKCSTPVNLRKARTCYDHLAGEVAVKLYAIMEERGWFTPDGSELSGEGIVQFRALGAHWDPRSQRKTACGCLDWSERRLHLGGSCGAALLVAFERHGWLTRLVGYREVNFTEEGKRALTRIFKLTL